MNQNFGNMLFHSVFHSYKSTFLMRINSYVRRENIFLSTLYSNELHLEAKLYKKKRKIEQLHFMVT